MKRAYLLLILMLVSCTILGEQPSILDDSSCDPPCWNGIVAGETTKDKMLTIIKENPNVDQGSISIINSPWKIYDGGVNFLMYPKPVFSGHDVVVQSKLLKDQVIKISFCGKLGITFDDVLRRITEPENVVAVPSPSGGLFVIAVNSKVGVEFSYDTMNAPTQLRTKIVPEIQIGCLTYFDPSLYDEMLEAAQFSAGHLNAEQTLKAMRPWVGYGDLNQYMP